MKIKNEQNISRIKWAIKNKVCHFAPTISPAPKDIETNEIESIKKALEYYINNNVDRVILQPKYMGSYCDILISKNIEESIFYSKKGYIIDHLDRNKLLEALKPVHDKILDFFNWNNITHILIQSELLPWSAMGEKLIDREFSSYNDIHKIHSNYLSDIGVFDKIAALKKSSDVLSYKSDLEILSSDEIKNKYKQHEIRNFNNIININDVDVDLYKKSTLLHKEQIDVYGFKSEKFSIKPFNLLKIFYVDGTEYVNESNIFGFENLNDDKFIVLNLDDFDKSVSEAYKYFDSVTIGLGMEGIIIKPTGVYTKDVAPMFKVRSNEYLVLIYGIDFHSNFVHYINKRKIDKKLKASMNEWKISQALLRIHNSEISVDNAHYVDLVEKRIHEEKMEESIDGRL